MNIAEIRFLVVEDQGFQRWITGNLLEGMGAKHVYTAGDGQAALEILADADPPIDVIISDLDMPGMDGMEFIRHVGEGWNPVSLIVASALDRALVSSVEAMARAYGVNLLGAIEKPATAKKLQALLALHAPSRQAPRSNSEEVSPAEIAEGLRRGEFEPFFQPKVDLAGAQFKGAEANARWRHPAKGIIAPVAFISSLETSGLIDKLTVTILKSAAHNCQLWRSSGVEATVSVNLSLTMLSDTSLADRMTSVVEAEGLEAKHVIFEVTESAAAANLGKALENVSRLRMKGFGLSIDDYGTGYSSMERLARVPFTELKIDKSFVQNAPTQPSSRAMLESCLEVAQKLDIVAVAEGIESQPQWDLLRALGCPLGQGYFIAKPMDAGAFLDWLRVRRQITA
jgi:EAL domain-containing protein (putative c-di-GMP-specific phosphodiesterase class I)/CheY-like chemotaxis protein